MGVTFAFEEFKLPDSATYPQQAAHCGLAESSMHDVDLDLANQRHCHRRQCSRHYHPFQNPVPRDPKSDGDPVLRRMPCGSLPMSRPVPVWYPVRQENHPQYDLVAREQ